MERSAAVIVVLLPLLFCILGGDSIESNSRSKYNVDLKNKAARTYDGIVFDSAGEMKMYRDFLLPQMEKGSIINIERQKTYILVEGFTYNDTKIRPITYVADFVVTYATGKTVVYDFKGMPDSVAKLKRKLFWNLYPNLELEWIVYSKIDGGYVPYETAQKGRKERRKAKNKENES